MHWSGTHMNVWWINFNSFVFIFHRCVCVSFMPVVHGPDYRTECDPWGHWLRPSEPVARGSFVCTGGVRTIPGAMGPRGSGATTYDLSPPPVGYPRGNLEAPGGNQLAFSVRRRTHSLMTRHIRMCEALSAGVHSVGQADRVQDPTCTRSEYGYP